MDMILFIVVILASLLIIASGFWVGVALVRALAVPRHVASPAPVPKKDAPA